jgi:uracil phosphoribosyltransferase
VTQDRERRTSWELAHGYGPRVHILDNPYLEGALARLGSPEARLHEVLALVRTVYETLLVLATREFPSVAADVPTRMAAKHPREGVLSASVFDPDMRVVVCDIIRAGMIPSQVCFERLMSVMPDECVRLDHLAMSRVTDAEGHVTGVDLSGSKIGGTVEGSILLVPDPMGATGSTTVRALEHYLEHHGRPARVVCLPMIATPEYLRRVLDRFRDHELAIYTARLDRGMSPPEVLAAPPGTYWEQERGLDDASYIVPGAGGMGEVLNNSWC